PVDFPIAQNELQDRVGVLGLGTGRSASENEDAGIDEVAKSVDLLFLAVLILGGNPDVNRRVLPQAGFRFSILRRVAIGPHKKVMRRLCKREGVVLEVSGVGGAPVEIVEP